MLVLDTDADAILDGETLSFRYASLFVDADVETDKYAEKADTDASP